jgi:RimJ/RimL family protein N-acetyltransferase
VVPEDRRQHDGHVDVFLETERLLLHRFSDADADLLVELDSDPAVMRYLSGGEATSQDEVRQRVLPSILAGYDRWDGRLGLFAARVEESGDFIGWFCLRPDRNGPRDEAELGYRLRQAAWGKGYATEGSRGLLDRGFSELGVQLVWAETATVNRSSRNVLEKLGMSLVGTIDTPPDMSQIEGAEHGGVRYETTSQDWRATLPA